MASGGCPCSYGNVVEQIGSPIIASRAFVGVAMVIIAPNVQSSVLVRSHHCYRYFDLRNPSSPLSVFKGHQEVVSDAKFVSPNELESASTDSIL